MGKLAEIGDNVGPKERESRSRRRTAPFLLTRPTPFTYSTNSIILATFLP